MKNRSFAFYWALAAVVLVAVLWFFKPILFPFLLGFVLAYIFNPLVDKFVALKFPRLLVVSTIILLFFCFVGVIGLTVAPLFYEELIYFLQQIPGYLRRVRPWLESLQESAFYQFVQEQTAEASQDYIKTAVAKVSAWISVQVQALISGGVNFLGSLPLFFLTPVVTFYLLADWHKMLATVQSFIPKRSYKTVHNIAVRIDTTLAGFIRGQMLVCLSLATFYGVLLPLTGLKFGFILGVLVGLLSFIPYVASLGGLVVAMLLSAVQFWPDYGSIFLVMGVFLAGQALEGNVLTPYLVGERIGLHPVWVLFALLALGFLWGFVGVILAVPLAAIASVLLREALARYKKSSFYLNKKTP